MGKCLNHPDRESSYICMKHNYYLCDECLECHDPDIYCKFRTSCPIHFISKKGFKSSDDESDKQDSSEKKCIVLFKPEEAEVIVDPGTNLLDAAQKADIYINASCKNPGGDH